LPERTVTRSFRITESAFLALEEEAKKHNISLNTLVNQLLLSFANFDRYFQRFGMTKISKVSYRKTLKAVPDEQLIELAKEVAKNSGKVIILARYGTMSLKGVLDWLRDLADYANWFQYNEVRSPDGKRVITLTHDMGPKFSTFMIAYSKEMFGLVDLDPRLSSTEDSVTIGLDSRTL
jgi:hypothetical protein